MKKKKIVRKAVKPKQKNAKATSKKVQRSIKQEPSNTCKVCGRIQASYSCGVCDRQACYNCFDHSMGACACCRHELVDITV